MADENSSTGERETQPTEQTLANEDLPFRVWCHRPSYIEDKLPWKCIAAFRYLLECVEFIDYCHSRECDIVFQSPAHTTLQVAPVRVEQVPSECPF